MKKIQKLYIILLALCGLFVACEDDNQPPLAAIYADVDAEDSYTMIFNSRSENTNNLMWDFGDGTSATGESVTHTYNMSGEYTVTLTASGDNGEYKATKKVTITASMLELLSGGPDAANGKTWVLSRTATPGFDGAGSFDNTYPKDIMPGTDNLLDLIGLGSEYDNEFTFFHDGSYAVDNKNAVNLAGGIFGYGLAQQGLTEIVAQTPVGIFAIKMAPISGAGWTLTQNTDLVVDAVKEGANGTFTEKTVTFEKANYLTFSNGGFIGIQDFAVHAIIRDIKPNRMVVSVFMHGVPAAYTKPSHLVTVSFDAK